MLFLALGDAKVPDARYFAFWWNIGLSICMQCPHTCRECTLLINLVVINRPGGVSQQSQFVHEDQMHVIIQNIFMNEMSTHG